MSGRRAKADRAARPPRRPPMWALNEAKHTTAIVVAHHHAGVVTVESALAIAETAVAAVLNSMPRILAVADPSRLGGGLTDPRQVSGAGMVGLDDAAYTARNVIVDARQAVLLDVLQVALVEATTFDGGTEEDRPLFGLQLNGRINKSTDRAQILFLADLEAAATIVAEVIALAMRSGPALNAELSGLINTKLAELMPQPPAPPEGTTQP